MAVGVRFVLGVGVGQKDRASGQISMINYFCGFLN